MYAPLLAQQPQPSPTNSYGTLDSAQSPSPPSADMMSPKVASDSELAEVGQNADSNSETPGEQDVVFERRIRLKVDFRLCTIAGILCSLNLLDSGVISSASVTSMLADVELDKGNRYSVSIFIFTIASICFQLPSTVAVRTFGPRRWFSFITCCFGLITLCTGFIRTWKEMIALRILLGASMAGIYPGLAYLISTWYTREEQQLRFAFLQSGQVIILATGSIVNYGLNRLDGRCGLSGWRWMFIVQGAITMLIGLATYWWIVDFPEHAHRSFLFLSPDESAAAARRIHRDRADVHAAPFSAGKVLAHARDPKVYGLCCLFFLQNVVSTALAYFLPLILQGGMGFSAGAAILLAAPPYYYAVVPALLSSLLGDRYRTRAPVIVFNCACVVVGFAMLGLAQPVAVRYIGTFLATGAYVANWAALMAYQANNVVGQWKRVFTAAMCTAFNGAGGIAGSYIVRNSEAPRYPTAVWVSIGQVVSPTRKDRLLIGCDSSHIFMVGIVLIFSVYFTIANRAQKRGKKVLEATEGFRFTI